MVSLLHAVWVPYSTDDGSTYYYNTVTGEVQWEHEFMQTSGQTYSSPAESAEAIRASAAPLTPSPADNMTSPLKSNGLSSEKIGAVWNRFFENAIMESEKRRSFSAQPSSAAQVTVAASAKLFHPIRKGNLLTF